MTVVKQQDLAKRLHYVLHCGFTEIRNLAGVDGASQQIHDLADAMEILPRYLEDLSEEDWEMVRSILCDYHKRYPHSRDYVKYLDECEIPHWY